MRTLSAKVLLSFTLVIFLFPGLVQATQYLPHHPPAAVTQLNLKSTGQLPASAQMNLIIGLPWRHPEALTNLLHDLYDPVSPQFHHYLTPGQFAEQFSPNTNDYDALATFVAAHGLTITHRHPNRMLLDVSGPASAVANVLHVHMLTYHHPTEKRDFFAPDTTPSFDAPVQVLDINGLDNYGSRESYAHLDTNFTTAFSGPISNAGSSPGGFYMGYDFRDAYMPNVTLTGAGQNIGLFEMDGYNVSDIKAYEQQAGLPNVTLTNVFLDSITNNVAGANALEDTLDIDMALSMAPGINSIIVYEGTNTADILNRMATDDLASQLSSSWKPFDASALTDQALQELAAQGQSMFLADGDSDAQPALDITQPSSPYETLVGGTMLSTTGGLGSWTSESVWNNRVAGVGTGGGVSTVYPIPWWQTNVITIANQGSTTFRNSPDVALVSSNIFIIFGVEMGRTGGTSAAAPLWAGITALINQQASQHGLPPVGFLNPAIYAIGMSSKYNSCFHDITIGNNFSSSSPSEFSAEPGYDLCTGWGTPTGQSFIDALMPFLSITPSGNQLLINWPEIWTNAVLQQNSSLATTNWVTVTNAVNLVNDQLQVSVNPGGTNEFFRLLLP